MTRLMAPILSFTAEQLSDCYQKNKKDSIHLQDFPQLQQLSVDELKKKEAQWGALRDVRGAVLKALEALRQKGTIKHSLEAKVTLTMNTTTEPMTLIKELLIDVKKTSGQSEKDFLKEFFIVSACDWIETEVEYEQDNEDEEMYFVDSVEGLQVRAGHAAGNKCPRCWQWEATDHENGLCKRCQKVVTALS
jgi:isoleucyl-tRNA synthetase